MRRNVLIVLAFASVMTLISVIPTFQRAVYYPGAECSGGVCRGIEEYQGLPVHVVEKSAQPGPLDGVQYREEMRLWALLPNLLFWSILPSLVWIVPPLLARRFSGPEKKDGKKKTME